MRRKQLYAIILAGALAASSAPAAVFAAEGDVAATAETSEENPVDGEAAAATEAPAEQAPADTTAATEAPAEQAPAQEAAAATEAPAQEAAPAEQTQQTTEETPTVQETPAAEITEAPEAGEETNSAEGETTGPTAISIPPKDTEGTEGKARYFDTIQHAINAAPDYNAETAQDATVIEVSGQIALDATVTVPANKKVCIRAKDAVTITRASDAFTDDMFKVSGENAELQFDVKEGASFTVSGAAGESNTQAIAGTIVNVSEGAIFGIINAGVTLKDNNTSAEGGAITNKGGNIVLYDGTITGNTGAKGGGIYTDTSINVQGTVVVNENKKVTEKDTEVSNICLDGATTMINVTDVLTGSDISFVHLNEADALTVVKAGVNSEGTALTADNFKTVIDANAESQSQIKYENKGVYTLNLAEDNLSVVLKKTEPVDPVNPNPVAFVIKETGSVSWSDYTTATAYFNTTNDCKWYYERVKADATVSTDGFNESKATNSASAGDVPVNVKNIPTGDYAIAVYAKSQTDGTVQALKIVLNNRKPTTFKISQASNTKVEWEDHNTATVYFTATHDCKWYSQVTKTSTKKFSLADSKAVNTAKAGDVVSATVKDIPEGEGYAIVVLARSTQDNAPAVGKFSLDDKNRPAKSSTATRKAKTYSVTDNKVTGLENPLKFFPSKKYEFTVTEAGMSDEAPYVVGDERYAFLYWSTSSSGKNPQAKKVIMSSKGIPDANTYKMYLFFQKYRFNGTDWVKKGSPESISTEFSSAGYTDEELKEYLEEAKENGTEIPGYENGSGSGDDADAELTATAAASEKDAGSKSKSAVSTADESPIGTMSALAALSLLAGGYIVVRKRKKEEL